MNFNLSYRKDFQIDYLINLFFDFFIFYNFKILLK